MADDLGRDQLEGLMNEAGLGERSKKKMRSAFDKSKGVSPASPAPRRGHGAAMPATIATAKY